MATTAPARVFRAEPYDYSEARTLASALDLAEPIAVTLVRRGYRTVQQARAFLEAGDDHDPFGFDGMREACEQILAVAGRGGRITVHGDYDVDGVCSTAILVAALRELGGTCDWLIPDRLADGYGLTPAGVEQLGRRGTELLVTVDCGIGSAAEIEAAQRLGIGVIVTDHHEPPAALPPCRVLHPVVSGYPFSALCAAGVAHKLATALREVAGKRFVETAGGRRDLAQADLDLVALATVADMVPLIGENRRLVRQGLAAIRTSPRPGLRALIAASRVEPETVDEGALGFRLAPRINAAGRLYRADAGVELMLTDDPERAAAIASELDRANSERRATEREVSEAAEAARAALSPEQAEAPALVLAGEGWHPGVVGIAASRLAERHWRPTVLISMDGDRGRGSARSIPGFDLITALDACSEHLVRHGGHRAAAGLELRRESLDAFREAFLSHAGAAVSELDLVRSESVDALVGVGREGIGMELAEQLERLAPFGMGNPDPRLVVPSARLSEIRPLGQEGRHSRFELRSGAGRASGVAFGMNSELSGLSESDPLDLSVRLEVDRWNGAVQPRVVLRDLQPVRPSRPALRAGCASGCCPAPDQEWWDRFEATLNGFQGTWSVAPRPPRALPARSVIDRRGGAAVAALAELVSSGDSVLALCADGSRRSELALSAVGPRRFGAGGSLVVCGRCGEAALDSVLGAPLARAEEPGEQGEASGGELALADWAALAQRPAAPWRFRHVVLVDPPPFEQLDQLATRGSGFLHMAWGRPELELAGLCAGREWEPRAAIAEIWRSLTEAGGELGEGRLREALAGAGKHPRSPEVAARSASVLSELGLCEWQRDGSTGVLRVLSSEETKLERSRAYAACVARHEEARRYLRSRAPS